MGQLAVPNCKVKNMKHMLENSSRFGDYTVVCLLGKGAMGEVYKISDGQTNYALKIMRVDADAPDTIQEWRRRFAHEADVAMRIRHPNLIEVYDVGEDPETHLCYILMEYVGGGTLSDRIKRKGKFKIREAVDIMTSIANALQTAHNSGIVHRDVKPDNIMFTNDGIPKLSDLGIARVRTEEDTSVTKTGMIVGTPAYMAPEQMLNSHDIDARVDIYSLGIVFYEMLTGARPNKNMSVIELMAKAIKGEELPDVRTLRPEVSASLAYALSRLVSQKAEMRPASVAEAAKLVVDAASGKIVVKKPKVFKQGNVRKREHASEGGGSSYVVDESGIRISWRGWIGFAVALLLAASAVFYSLDRHQSTNDINSASLDMVSGFFANGGIDSTASSNDGIFLVSKGEENEKGEDLSSIRDDKSDLYQQGADGATTELSKSAESRIGREVPIADVPERLKAGVQARIEERKYVCKCSSEKMPWSKGRVVYGCIEKDGLFDLDHVSSPAYFDDEGYFTAAMASDRSEGYITFMSQGYEKLVVYVPEVYSPWRDDVAVDLGTLKLKKLKDEDATTLSFVPRLPQGVEYCNAVIRLLNWHHVSICATSGRSDEAIVFEGLIRNGERFSLEGCLKERYSIVIKAPGCVSLLCENERSINLAEKQDLGDIEIMRVRDATFRVKPTVGGEWRSRTVNVDGSSGLIVQENNTNAYGRAANCIISLYPYLGGPEEVKARFAWTYTRFSDLGEKSINELADIESLPPQEIRMHSPDSVMMSPGHLYRFANSSWGTDVLIFFEGWGLE